MIGLMYGRDMMLSLNRGQGPSTLVKERLRRLGISVTGRRRRGCRAGRRCRVTNLRALGNGSFVVTSNRQPTECSAKKCRQSPSPTPPTAVGNIADGAASTDMSDAAGARHRRPNLATTHVTDHRTARFRLHERALGGRENRRHHRHET